MCHQDDRTTLENLIARMEAETPATAWGYYAVEKTTLTSLLSTIVTYLIILIQFKSSEPSSDTESVTPLLQSDNI